MSLCLSSLSRDQALPCRSIVESLETVPVPDPSVDSLSILDWRLYRAMRLVDTCFATCSVAVDVDSTVGVEAAGI